MHEFRFKSTFRGGRGTVRGAVGVQTGAAANTRSPAKKELCVGVEIQVPRAEPQNSWILKAFV